MLNLRTYFENNFDDKQISDAEIRQFTEDHLRRLSVNDPTSQFGALLTATTTAYSEFFGDISDTDTHAAVREGLTIAMNAALDRFTAQVQRREGRIRDAFGKTSPQYQEFFPHGLSEYSSATLGNVETLMKRFATATEQHKATLGQDLATEFATLKQTFLDARGAQLGKKGAVAGSRSDTKTTRAALEKQLMTNLLTLALHFVGQPDAGLAFFDQSIIRPAQPSAATPSATPTPKP